MHLAQKDFFGPVLSAIEADSFEAAININNDTRCGLSSATYTQDINNVERVKCDLTTGTLYITPSTIGAEILFLFGGTCGAGNDSLKVDLVGLDVFTEWKSSLYRL